MSSDAPAVELYRPEFDSSWSRYQLHGLATWINGMAFRDINFALSGTPVVKIAEIKNGVSGQTRFTCERYDDKYFLRNGDMLFCWSGQPETSIDTYWWHGGDGWLNQHIFKVLPNTQLVDRNFLYQLLRYLRPTFVRIARNKQTTGLGHVTKSDLQGLEVALPGRKEQQAIAATLRSLDDKIESNRRAIDLIEGLVASHFSRRFSAEPSEAGIPIPELVDVNPRRSLAKGEITTYIGMASLPENSMSIRDWDSRAFGSGQRFINGDVLMARITPCLENGKTAVVDLLADGEVAWGSTEYIVLAPRGNISTPWIYSLVRSEPVRSYAIRGMSGTSGRQRFAASSFDQYRVAAPDESDLCEFNALGIPLFERAASLRDECRALTSLRDTLLPELLSGRIRVPVEVAA